MRSVTFVRRLTLEISGSVAQCAVHLADVNGDGEVELVVGTTNGELCIYKGTHSQVWRRCSNLGFITAIGVGDLLNAGRDVLVATSGCGWLYIFDFRAYRDEEEEIEPTYRQRVPANIRDLIISDINGDGNSELVISLTDRVVRLYRWVLGAGEDPEEGREGKDPSFSGSNLSNNSENLSTSEASVVGRFVCINKWEFASQIGTISSSLDSEGNPAILISQPGGAFMRLRCKKADRRKRKKGSGQVFRGGDLEREGAQEEEKEDVHWKAKEEEDMNRNDDDEEIKEPIHEGVKYNVETATDNIISSMSVEYEPMGINRRSNPNVSSEVLGGFHTGKDGLGTRYAIVTLDGTILLVDDVSNRKPVDCILWNLQVDHQLMCLSKLDITGDGLEEVICCSWDGETYIISQGKQAVRFQFEDSVSTFTAGKFTLAPGNTQPVLVYVTFNNKIQIYYDLCLGQDLTLSSLIHYPPMLTEAAEVLDKLGCSTGNLHHLQQVYSYCLYGFPTSSE